MAEISGPWGAIPWLKRRTLLVTGCGVCRGCSPGLRFGGCAGCIIFRACRSVQRALAPCRVPVNRGFITPEIPLPGDEECFIKGWWGRVRLTLHWPLRSSFQPQRRKCHRAAKTTPGFWHTIFFFFYSRPQKCFHCLSHCNLNILYVEYSEDCEVWGKKIYT